MNKTLMIFIFAGAALLLFSVRRIRPTNLMISALCGIAALLGASTVGHLWGLCLPVNAFTALTGALGGIPGVILLVALKTVGLFTENGG